MIAPGFIDTHIHGFGGFGTEDFSADSILGMSRLLVQHGVTAFNPTLYPAEPELMLKAVKEAASAIGREEGAQIMGLHLEGPFISPERLGAMKAEAVQPVSLGLMEKLWDASGGRIVNMTVAPELKGMRELALFCLKKGIILQAGHTDAKYENMVEGTQAGILHSTHLFNAMSRMEHRNPNAVGAVLIHPEISCEIIADGHHIHPDLYKLLLRNKRVDKIVLVTDALKPTEQAKGPFYANGEEVVFRDGVFHKKADDIIAGSALTMIRGVKNLVNFGFSLEDAIKTSSFNPAEIMRYSNKGAIIPGRDADLAIFGMDFRVMAVVAGGVVKRNFFE
uniref:N-acetylglucosamine-6-phosphate deacetylase n=1 Tax=uncultured bacterium contig00086 TaxID=1181559 RepID=A0A806K1E1_9BACT|nr:N-acetylglucosamine-6-phosphate deacetylase [uncultured bacterium contig00086]